MSKPTNNPTPVPSTPPLSVLRKPVLRKHPPRRLARSTTATTNPDSSSKSSGYNLDYYSTFLSLSTNLALQNIRPQEPLNVPLNALDAATHFLIVFPIALILCGMYRGRPAVAIIVENPHSGVQKVMPSIQSGIGYRICAPGLSFKLTSARRSRWLRSLYN